MEPDVKLLSALAPSEVLSGLAFVQRRLKPGNLYLSQTGGEVPDQVQLGR